MEEILKIALAAYLHDIGKFAQRGDMKISDEYRNNNAQLYQPYNKTGNYHTHIHAVYTAAFIEFLEKILPSKFNRGNWGFEESLINLAASHNKPETSLQQIISTADRISSGFDRNEFDVYNQSIDFKDFKKTRLLTIFEQINFDGNDYDPEELKYRYQLKELSPVNIFPDLKENVTPSDDNIAQNEYKDLFNEFVNCLEKLEHKDYLHLWFEHFDNLFMIFASNIPAATVGKVVYDVSLYDHCKMTSAIATALYKYHKETNSLNENSIKDYKKEKFLLINGNFFGIQNYIFSSGGSTNKYGAKLLRGRSFFVSLLTELASDYLCRELELPFISVILNAAGSFTILAPNTTSTIEKVQKIEKILNKWFMSNYYGEVLIGLSYISATSEDFVLHKFNELWLKLFSLKEEKKYNKFNLDDYAGVVENYLDNFNNNLSEPLCSFCGKRPATENIDDGYSMNNQISICKICADQKFIGENLVKTDKVAIFDKESKILGKRLNTPIFDKYQISFDIQGALSQAAKNDQLYKYWDISIAADGKISKNITSKFINGYVPVYSENDDKDDRYLYGEKSESSKLELIDMIKEGMQKTFHHISKMSLINNNGDIRGTEAIGVIKADVDNLGLIFSKGLKEERICISRLSTLSRQMNNFFAVFIPHYLKTNESCSNIYTIFSGGDDLLLIGPVKEIIGFAYHLNKKFGEYVCKNNNITLSAGITMHKPYEPISRVVVKTEDALEHSKMNGRDSITLYNETVKWKEFYDLLSIRKILESWLIDEKISKGVLYKLNEFTAMAKEDHSLRKNNTTINIEDLASFLLWRANLKYCLIRNAAKKLKGDDKNKAIDQIILDTVKWLESYEGKFKISLWQILYDYR